MNIIGNLIDYSTIKDFYARLPEELKTEFLEILSDLYRSLANAGGVDSPFRNLSQGEKGVMPIEPCEPMESS